MPPPPLRRSPSPASTASSRRGNGRKPSGAANGTGDARKIKTAARGGAQPCSGDGRGAMIQAEQQLSEFTPQSPGAATAAQTRPAAASPCAHGGGAARERGRGNPSFVAYGLVNGGRGVAQAAVH